VAPLVAVWRAVEARHADAHAHVLCADRPEELRFCDEEGLTVTGLPVPRMGIGIIGKLWRSARKAAVTIDAFQPDIVFSKGGGTSVMPCWIARRRGIPVVLHESDAVMGRANKLLRRWASVVCLGFAETKEPHHLPSFSIFLPSMRGIPFSISFTGNPIRPEIPRGNRTEGLRITGLSGTRPIVLVWGGSQGAQALNATVAAQLPSLLSSCDVVHVTGVGKETHAAAPGYVPIPFAHRDLRHLLAIADIAVSRAGAGSISELAACGIPMILVPLRGLAQDHQWHNARAAVIAGYAELLEQEQFHELAALVSRLLTDTQRRQSMADAGKRLNGDAAQRIADILDQTLAQRR
jgi:UDP-N-acetylglucosamine--N-acetylmuramyl-(pentapeptide) pyrophosphoryl-undecaprenol N-acetylglucosamine transferase